MAENNFKIRKGSLEYLPVRVEGTRLGNPYDPTGDVVKIALPVINVDPILSDWKSGVWQTVDDEFIANILVGPGGDVNLDRGDYDILVQIAASPEAPILRAGMLTVV